MVRPGTRLGPYELVALVGEGGMGQVFKARDTRLERTVAIKMLPASVAADRVRRERFEREARNISRLEHPNICPLYDVGEHDGHLYLVMQFLDGGTLAERLQAGPLSIKQTLEYAIQIAEALAAAHRADIVHRDLKPGNVMITRTGVRLVDFGLARSVPRSASLTTTGADPTPSASALTVEGTILGTLSYMAPEQLEGRDVDARADVFAFGAVLFEMVTGLKAFDGESPAQVMSAILRDEPARVSSIVPVTPAALDALIHECLAKDRHERWQNISDVSRQLRHLRDLMSGQKSGSLSATSIMAPRARSRVTTARVAWAAAAVLLLTAAAFLAQRFAAGEPAPARLQLHALIAPPEGMYLTDTLALSPDATRLAFVAADGTGRRRLWLRPLAANRAEVIADTDNASDPFWSPDGEHIAFFSDGKLKRVAASGGSVTTIADVPNGAGGSWNSGGVILYAQLDAPLMRVASSGGQPEPVTAFDRGLDETHHLYPAFLPDGDHFLYYINSRERGLYVGALGATAKTRLFDPDPELPAGAAATPGVYAHTGHLLYVRDRVLTARRFDADALTVSGQPITVTETVDYDPPGQAAFTMANGVLVFRARQHRPMAELRWVDRSGKEVGAIPSPPGTFRAIALSPDGRTLAVDRRDPQGLPSVWLVEVEGGVSSRLTAAYWAGGPLFSPDGRTLAYSVAVDSPPNIVVRATASDGTERRVTRHASEQHYATSFTPDGQQLVYQALAPTTGMDLHLVSLAQPGATAQRLLQTRANESLASVSPDGRWLAYVSDESGQSEVYVSRFPELQGRVLVSSGGGSRPFWRRDGKELFYVAAASATSRLMAVTLNAAPTQFTADVPVELFRAALYSDLYVPASDGRRFLLARPAPNAETVPLEVVVNPLP